MQLLVSKFNEKKFFLRSQLYARAYVRIWTLRPCTRVQAFLVRSYNRSKQHVVHRPCLTPNLKEVIVASIFWPI